jgi:Methylamine utilisation protein MauE
VELIGPYLIACTLLIVAGVMKAVRPDDTARALVPLVPARLGALATVPRLRSVIRGVALIEAGLGMVAFVLPRAVPAALVAASYVVFAGVVAYARARGGALASCGCFGTPDTPATLLHVAVDLVFAVAAVFVATAASSGATVFSVLGSEPLHGVALLMVSAVGAWLTYLTLSLLGSLQAARRTVGLPGRR